ncbi:MAG: hypothetical protein AAGC44_12115 [Planctomycetota bacterium]
MNVQMMTMSVVSGLVGLAGLFPLYAAYTALRSGEAWVRTRYRLGRAVRRDTRPLTYWLRFTFQLSMGVIFGIGGLVLALILFVQAIQA